MDEWEVGPIEENAHLAEICRFSEFPGGDAPLENKRVVLTFIIIVC